MAEIEATHNLAGDSGSLINQGTGFEEIPQQTQLQTETQAFDYKSHLSDELKANPLLERVPDLETLTKNYIQSQKHISATRATIPGQDATPADWDAFYTSIGRPETAEGYVIPEIEGFTFNEPFMKGFHNSFHKYGLTSKQADGIQRDFAEHFQDLQNQQTVQAETQLKETWGDVNYQRNVGRAEAVIKRFAPEGAMEHFVNNGYGRDPIFLQLMANVGRQHVEDGVISTQTGSIMSKEGAIEKRNTLQKTKAYTDSRDPEHQKVVQEVFGLNQYIFENDQRKSGVSVTSSGM
jgi:hypothetical protein